VFKSDVGRAVEILSDILLKSKLDFSAIDRERDVILREMSEVNNKEEKLVLDHLHGTAFQGTGLGRTILGPEENIRSLTQDETLLRSYYETQIQDMIQSTHGAEVCASDASSSTSSKRKRCRPSSDSNTNDCVYAYDKTYNTTVSLSAYIVIGNLVPMDGMMNRWRVPYNVMDEAGNSAVMVYRDIAVEEVDFLLMRHGEGQEQDDANDFVTPLVFAILIGLVTRRRRQTVS
jgi:hypothetical protein